LSEVISDLRRMLVGSFPSDRARKKKGRRPKSKTRGKGKARLANQRKRGDLGHLSAA